MDQPTEKKQSELVVVPLDKISEEALHGLINEFIQREGTDYGTYEYSLEQKHAQILKQLVAEKIVVVFDINEESASIVPQEKLKNLI